MKKQLTIFAAAGLLASIVGAAHAATPTFNLTGTFKYTVEYNATTQTWVDQADKKLKPGDSWDQPFTLSASVATTGNPNLGTVTLTLADKGNDDTNVNPDITLVGTLGDATVKLGKVGTGWDDITSGEGKGAEVIKPYGKTTVDLVTRADDSNAGVANGFKVSTSLSDKTTGFVGGLFNPEKAGTVFAGYNTKFGNAAVTLRGAKEVNDDKGYLYFGKVELPLTAATKVTAKAIGITKSYNQFLPGDDWRGWDSYNWQKNGGKDYAYLGDWRATGKPNVNVRADITAIKDVSNVYAEVDVVSDQTKYTAKVGASFKPIFLDDAYLKVDEKNVTTLDAKFSRAIGGGFNLRAGVGATVNGSAVTNGGAILVKKNFDWLGTWVGVAKAYNVHDWEFGYDSSKPFAVLAGASASITF